MCSTPVSECESLMESLLLDIRNGLGRRSLRRPHDPSPSPGELIAHTIPTQRAAYCAKMVTSIKRFLLYSTLKSTSRYWFRRAVQNYSFFIIFECHLTDVTPTGSLRRRSRASPGEGDEEGLLEFLRHSSPAANDLRERSAWGSLGEELVIFSDYMSLLCLPLFYLRIILKLLLFDEIDLFDD